jgi:hypothetical protein
MGKDIRIDFQTTSEINNALNKLARDKKLSVSEVIDSIITQYLKNGSKESQGIKQDHRRFERKKVDLRAHIGDPRWQPRDFEAVTIMDISFGGIGFSVPKGTKLEIGKKSDGSPNTFSIIFRLPDSDWPIRVQISPQRVFESTEQIQVGAALVNTNFYACAVLQKYLI